MYDLLNLRPHFIESELGEPSSKVVLYNIKHEYTSLLDVYKKLSANKNGGNCRRMKVQDVIRCIPYETLLGNVMAEEDELEVASMIKELTKYPYRRRVHLSDKAKQDIKSYHNLKDVCKWFVRRIQQTIQVDKSKRADKVMLYTHVVRDNIQESDILLFTYADLEANFRIDEDIEDLINSNCVNELTINEVKDYIQKLSKIIPNSYAFEFDLWEDVLSYDVLESNVKNLSKKALQDFVMSIIHEMLFFGFDQSFRVKEKEKLIERKRKVDLLYANQQKESSSNLYEKFKPLDLGIEKDDEDVEDYIQSILNRESLFNSMSRETDCREKK